MSDKAWLKVGLALVVTGLMLESLTHRFHRFFDWGYALKSPEAVKVLLSRLGLVVGVVLILIGGLAELIQ